MINRLSKLSVIVVLALAATSCAAGRAYQAGAQAMKAGDLDQAVAYYRTAVQASPDNPNYKIGLERAMQAASRAHFEKAREFEALDQLEAARSEYKLSSEYDPSNRTAAAKVAGLDQILRQRAEAARPRPAIEQLRERARTPLAIEDFRQLFCLRREARVDSCVAADGSVAIYEDTRCMCLRRGRFTSRDLLHPRPWPIRAARGAQWQRG